MKRRILSVVAVLVLLAAALPGSIVGAQPEMPPLPLPVDIDARLKHEPAPAQNYAEGELAAEAVTTEAQCFGEGEFLTLTISGWDPDNPLTQDVVFWKETAETATGKATLWVAWDFLATLWRQDVITCEQLEYLQGQMDHIVETDVKYFGAYINRPADNDNIDVMIYNIVDEGYFVEDYPTYIAGFFWSSINELFDRNMIFIDSYDWENRLGADVARPFLYEGTVAHELEHLIHNDHDGDEDSWVDEGLADLAQYFCGYGHDDGHVIYYLAYHRTPLTVWGGGLESYGASYLFQLYLLENFSTATGTGDDVVWDPSWTLGLVAQQANSIEGVELETGAMFNNLYDSWIVANYLDDPEQAGAGGFPIGYDTIDLTPFVATGWSPWSIERSITDIYGADHKGNVPLPRYWGGYKSSTVEYPVGDAPPYAPFYGLYKGMEPVMDIYLRGAAYSGVAPHGGMYEVAAGNSNMLTDRMLLLNTPVGGTLTFWTWFDIEEDWDFGFVEVSTDGGATWAPLAGSITRESNNPFGSTAWANSLVGGMATTNAAITGKSTGWEQGIFTLPAGDVLVRFSYYTDESTLGQGWFIDDVAVNGFSDDFESGYGNWTLGGWTHTTGLFQNDWMAGYVNPVYENGKLQDVLWDYLADGVPWVNSQGALFEVIEGWVDTSRLNKDEATVFFSNRPDVSPFSAGYLLLVEKGSAAP
jgi:hypothetical protein